MSFQASFQIAMKRFEHSIKTVGLLALQYAFLLNKYLYESVLDYLD